jgi:putative Ca2+/H+ antiporter (TMEM165/GDT1 family)
MDWKIVVTTFSFVFVAELGDKTQLATLLFSAEQPGGRWAVFIGATLALALSAAIGVLAGAWISYHVPEKLLRMVAGFGFILIGMLTLRNALWT